MSRRICKLAELAAIKLTQTSLMQQIQERHSEGRPRLAILDDQLDELEATREKLVLELAGAAIKLTQTSLMQQIQERHSEGRPRLAILDDQLDELEATREKLVLELAGTDAPAEDFQEKIARLKAQFDPA
ncbi:hypothetical protein ASD31_06825 [Rhizobium sp. Root482]|nr:hypothetical protein ASD31_06825 [Rhizobium sp. Root482]